MFLNVGHELTHSAEQGKSYLKLRSEIVNTFDKAGFDYSKLVDKKVMELSRQSKYKSYSTEELYRLADSETIADCCETMLQNSKLLENLINENKSFAEKLIEAIKKAIANLRAFFEENNLEAKTEYGKALSEAMNKVENRVQELWDKAVAEGIRAEKVENGGEKFAKRYAKQGGEWSNALTGAEWTKFNHAISTKMDAGLRVSVNSLLVECENNSPYQYKFVIYDNTFEDNPLKSIYAIGNIDYNIDDAMMIAKELADLEETGYEQKYAKKILKSIAKVHKIILRKYDSKNSSFTRIGNNIAEGRGNSQFQPNGTGVSKSTQSGKTDLKFSLRDNVEESDNLIAVHNLSEENLLKSLSLGGFPMPSIAVIRAKQGHEGYGDISLLFTKDTIDPLLTRLSSLRAILLYLNVR